MLTWLADVLRDAGVTVVEHDGWKTRGASTIKPKGIVCHHTAGPARGDAPSLNVCINGRSDLPGPLCHIVLARSGTAHVIAAGRANHAGIGGWHGLVGNSSVIGIEAENTGRGEPWPAVQVASYVTICAAICRHLGLGAEMVCGHKEWTPRKIDPYGIEMKDFRKRVAAQLKGEDIDMATGDEIMKKLGEFELRLIDIERQVPNNLNDQLAEIRRNLRKTAAAAGVAPGDIES
jgi:hypothetical protein